MTDRDEHPLDLDEADLDGHTVEELGDYLDAGRTPFDPSIENSPGCLLALDVLTRVRSLSPELLNTDDSPVDSSWVASLLSGIAHDARAGRRIPLSEPSESADIAITEGAVRGVIRGAEEAFPGLIIGKCHLDGELESFGHPVHVVLDVVVPFGVNIPDLVSGLRQEIGARLATHTRIRLAAVDIVVHDVAVASGVARG